MVDNPDVMFHEGEKKFVISHTTRKYIGNTLGSADSCTLNGYTLPGVKSVTTRADGKDATIVTIEFYATSVSYE